MKLPTDGDWMPAGVMCGVLMICAGGWANHAHAQPPEIPRIPVQRIEDIGALSRFVLTLRMIMAPAVRDQIGSLYAYDPTASGIRGLEVHPDAIGDVATVRRCDEDGDDDGDDDAPEEARWCAQYFDPMGRSWELLGAYRTAYRETETARRSNESTTYFATTYPLPGVEPERRFVSGLSP